MGSKKYQGIIIHRERLRRNWSQECLCKGICTVSYLSRIETGKADPSEEILQMLFDRLGLETNEQTEKESQALTEKAYDLLFCGMHEKLREMLSETDVMKYRASRCGVDLVLLKMIADSSFAKETEPGEDLTDSMDSMDSRQLALLHIIRGRQTEAILFFPNSYTYLKAGIRNYTDGNISAAIDQLQVAYDLAARRGFALLMLRARLFLGNCYGRLLDMENMSRNYQTARYLALALNDQKALDMIACNTASTRIQIGEYEEAYKFFSELSTPDQLGLYQLAVCCEKTGRLAEALEALNRMFQAPVGIVSEEIMKKFFDLILYRLTHENYLESEYYGDLIQECYEICQNELPTEFSWFHIPWMIEWLKATRQYKKACKLITQYPSISFLKEF